MAKTFTSALFCHLIKLSCLSTILLRSGFFLSISVTVSPCPLLYQLYFSFISFIFCAEPYEVLFVRSGLQRFFPFH